MLFCTKLQDISIKKIMTSVPGFPPKGFGTFINNRHSYTAKECDCTLLLAVLDRIVENCGLSYEKINFNIVKGKAKPKLTSGTLPPCSPF